jgi:queuine tRNA-ribosyltransferase
MSERTCEVVTIRSGVRALRDRASGEVMHCGSGPNVEPSELYVVPSRLDHRLREGGPPLVLFDVGLGAASNALAAWNVSESLPAAQAARRLEMVSFDRDLDALRLALETENAGAFGLSDEAPAARAAARALLANGRYDTERTSWRLAEGDFQTVLANEPEGSADIVFWDLYSPRSSPEAWTLAAFRALRRACRDGATLHTYSTATAARSALLLAGFAVGFGGGTGDRAQTTIAATRVGDLDEPLDARWLARLGRSTAAFPPDVLAIDAAAALEQIRSHVQFVEKGLGTGR